MKIGFIGAGRWALPFAFAAERVGVEIAGVYTPDTSGVRLADGVGCRVMDDPRMVVEAADCVLVGSPTDTHADYIRMAAGAGKAVYCASPVVANGAQVAELRGMAGSDRVFASLPFRARPEFARLKGLIDSGDLGQLGILRLGLCRPFPAGWRAEEARSGGMMLESGVHLLDLLMWLGGGIDRIYGAGNRLDGKEYELFVVRLACGAIAHLELSWAEPEGTGYEYYEVAGSNGLLDFDSRREPLLLVDYHGEGASEVLVPGATVAEHELRLLVEGLESGGKGLVGLEQALDVCGLAERVKAAVRAGQVLQL